MGRAVRADPEVPDRAQGDAATDRELRPGPAARGVHPADRADEAGQRQTAQATVIDRRRPASRLRA